jgi:hypothetical protein
MSGLNVNSARCEALFASALQRSEGCSADRVQQAIRLAVRQFGSSGCASLVAQEFGDHPELAVARMQWVRELVSATYRTAAVRVAVVDQPSRRPDHALAA